MTPASLRPINTLVPDFSQQHIVLKLLAGSETQLHEMIVGAVRDLGADQGKRYDQESQ